MPKKNIKDLIKKKQTKKEDQTESAKKEEEDPVNPTSTQTQADQTQKDNESPIAKAQQNYDSDDSLDDADIQTDSKLYGMITENKDDKEEQTKIEGYGLEDKTQKSETKAQENQPKKEKKNAGNISFARGGPMKFSRGPRTNNKMAGDFDVGLDDIDDSGNIKKEKKADKKDLSGANGGYEFRNLGATAQARGPKKDEEEKSKDSAPLQRPRFTGKLNLTKTGDGGDQQQNTGVTTSYGFNVKYKQENPDGKKEKKPDDANQEGTGESQPEMRKDRRHIDRGANKKQGNEFNSTADDDKDDGFEVVKDKDAQRRQQRRQKKYNKQESNSDEDDGFTVTKPNRGTQNRGGAFANMN